jgi:zinc/manganese transport system substrate-binding protein
MTSDKRRARLRFPAAVAVGSLAVGGCAVAAPPSSPTTAGPIPVVAAENFWGSIVAQVGGARVRVVSVITNPAADPHSYEPTAGDARRVADARLVVLNGVGYDPWMGRLVAADAPRPAVLDVGSVVHARSDANPHLWYDPADVTAFVAAVTASLSRIDPRYTAAFRAGAMHFETVDLAGYHATAAAIARRYAGTPVGASESIFAMLAPYLHLDLVTPAALLRAASEGGETSAADRATADRQIRLHRIRVFVYNAQNTTPDVRAQLAECRAAGIPTTAITETLSPASATYESWQTAQMRSLLAALEQAYSR